MNKLDKTSSDAFTKLTEKQHRALLKLSSLEEVPETQRELAQLLGITERTIYLWWRSSDWCSAVHTTMQKGRTRHLPAIEGALIKEAKRGSYPHQRGYYNLLGEPLEKNQTPVAVSNTVNIAFLQENRDKIKAIADQLADSIGVPPAPDADAIEGQIDG